MGPTRTGRRSILDILKRVQRHGTFFMIGAEAENNVGVMERVYREGHEIGNHTFTHPDISEISELAGRSGVEPDGAAVCGEAGGAAALFPAAVLDRSGAGHERSGRADRTHSGARATSSSATRSIPTTGTSIRARRRRRLRTASSSRLRTWRRVRGSRGSMILLHDGGGDRRQPWRRFRC